MQSDLLALCRDARTRIDVPAVPLDAIRSAAQPDRIIPGRPRWKIWTLSLLSVASIAAAAAAATWYGTHVTLTSGAVTLSADRITAKFRNASSKDVSAAVRSANFPVILPAGLPNGTRMTSVFTAGPSAVMLGYSLPGAWRASRHLVYILLANPAIVSNSSSSTNPAGKITLRVPALDLPSSRPPIRWRVGGEEVIVGNNTLTPSELARVKNAMLASARRRR